MAEEPADFSHGFQAAVGYQFEGSAAVQVPRLPTSSTWKGCGGLFLVSHHLPERDEGVSAQALSLGLGYWLEEEATHDMIFRDQRLEVPTSAACRPARFEGAKAYKHSCPRVSATASQFHRADAICSTRRTSFRYLTPVVHCYVPAAPSTSRSRRWSPDPGARHSWRGYGLVEEIQSEGRSCRLRQRYR
jgi:hypothetical protein